MSQGPAFSWTCKTDLKSELTEYILNYIGSYYFVTVSPVVTEKVTRGGVQGGIFHFVKKGTRVNPTLRVKCLTEDHYTSGGGNIWTDPCRVKGKS